MAGHVTNVAHELVIACHLGLCDLHRFCYCLVKQKAIRRRFRRHRITLCERKLHCCLQLTVLIPTHTGHTSLMRLLFTVVFSISRLTLPAPRIHVHPGWVD
jgi:hypothetical protein